MCTATKVEQQARERVRGLLNQVDGTLDRLSDERSSRATRPRKPMDELVRWERWE